MGALWVVAGVSAAGAGLGLWLFVRSLARRKRGLGFGILGGPILIVAAAALLTGYVTRILLPTMAVDTAVFNRPAQVDDNANFYYLSPRQDPGIGKPYTTQDTLIAFTARTGAIRWQRMLPSATAPGELLYAVADDIVYVATPTFNGLTVAAYRGADGVSLWQATVSLGSPPMTLTANGDTVYILSSKEQQSLPGSTVPKPPLDAIVALNASSGSQRWSSVAGEVSFRASMLIAAPSTVYRVTTTGVQAYRASDGTLLWTQAQADISFSMLPVTVGDMLYLPDNKGGFSALRANDGSLICALSDAARDNLPGNLFAAAGSTVYVTAQRLDSITDGQGRLVNPETVYAYDATTCAPRWRYATASPNAARALIAGGDAVYVNADDGIHALRATDGAVLWHRDAVNAGLQFAGWTFLAQPPVLGDTLIVSSPLLYPSIGLGGRGRVHIFAIGADGAYDWHFPFGPVVGYSPHFFSWQNRLYAITGHALYPVQ